MLIKNVSSVKSETVLNATLISQLAQFVKLLSFLILMEVNVSALVVKPLMLKVGVLTVKFQDVKSVQPLY